MAVGSKLHYLDKRVRKGDLNLQNRIVSILRDRGAIPIPELAKLVGRTSHTVRMSLVDLTYRYPEISEDDDGSTLVWSARGPWTWIDQ
jgi:hypothetical protein